MTINELNEFMRDHGFCNTNNEEDLPKKYVCDLVESALEEGRNKAIDEFTGQCIAEIIKHDCPLDMHDIDLIAEQLKAGGEDGNK